MSIEGFQKKIEKDYIFDKYWNYFFAVFFLFAGLFLLYKSLLTNWASEHGMSSGLYICTLILSFVLIYLGVIGFFNTPKLTQIYSLPTNGIDEGKERIFSVAQNLKIKLFPSEEHPNVIKGATYGLFIQGKDLLFFVDEKNIYVNIQQRNYKGPTYLGINSTKKLYRKIEEELLLNSSS